MKIDFKSLEQSPSHDDLYPSNRFQIDLKPTSEQVWPNQFQTFWLRSYDGQIDWNRFQINLKVCAQGLFDHASCYDFQFCICCWELVNIETNWFLPFTSEAHTVSKAAKSTQSSVSISCSQADTSMLITHKLISQYQGCG